MTGSLAFVAFFVKNGNINRKLNHVRKFCR